MITVDRYDPTRIIVRFDGTKDGAVAEDETMAGYNPDFWKEEACIKKTGLWKWEESEKAYLFPKQRILDLVGLAKSDKLEIKYPDDLLIFESENRKQFETKLAYLRLIRQVGITPDDIDYFATGQYKGYRTPYQHQLVCFQWLSIMESGALLCEMGTGKTFPTILVADEAMNKGEVSFCLVVGPKNVLWNWEREINENAPHRKVITLDGSRADRLEKMDIVADFYLINYEGVRVLGEDLKDRFQMVILDEAHKMKDPGTQQTKSIMKYLSTARRKVIMTGTPIGNTIIDLHQPFQFLDRNMFESFYTFRERYFYQDHYKWIPFPGTKEMIQDRIFQRAVRYLKTECLDLPPKTYVTRKTRLHPEQQKVYDQLTNQFIVAFQEGRIQASNVLAQIMKFSQITSGFVKMYKNKPVLDDTGLIQEELVEVDFEQNAKMELLEEVLDEIGDKKVVIWARFVRDIERIKKMLGSKAIAFYGKSHETPQQIVDMFNNSEKIQYLVGNPQVGGVGLNLTGADTMIYYSNDYSFLKRSQSEDRIHRIGAEVHEKITIIDLVVERTIDVIVFRALRDKKELANVVIDSFQAGIMDSFAEDESMSKLEEIFRSKIAVPTDIQQTKCPACGSFNIGPAEPAKVGTKLRYQCKDCETEFAVDAGQEQQERAS